MRKQGLYIYLVMLFVVSCKPAKRDYDLSVSYSSIQDIQVDSSLYRIIQPYKLSLDSQMNVVIGTSKKPLVKGEPVLGYFMADCVLEYARTIYNETDFCILNNGGIRASLPEGDITKGNVFELMPFDNEIVVVTLTGIQCKKVFQYIADKKGVPVSGIKINIGPNFNKDGYVYKDVVIGKESFAESRSYHIATSDYLAGGGDNMSFFEEGKIRTTSIRLRDAIIGYIRLQTDQDIKIDPVDDSRIGATY